MRPREPIGCLSPGLASQAIQRRGQWASQGSSLGRHLIRTLGLERLLSTPESEGAGLCPDLLVRQILNSLSHRMS